jgi:HPt (histidine-containing phosphotransfer) domain-containing protein
MMSQRLNEFLASEAGDYLDRLSRLLAGTASPERDELLRLARGIRGSARMAGAGPVADAAERLEREIAGMPATGAAVTAEARGGALRAIADLERLLYPREDDIVPISSLFCDDEGPHVIGEPAPAADDDAGAVVPVEELQFSGDAALTRALELRPALDSALAGASGPDPGALIDEIFDLIALGRTGGS